MCLCLLNDSITTVSEIVENLTSVFHIKSLVKLLHTCAKLYYMAIEFADLLKNAEDLGMRFGLNSFDVRSALEDYEVAFHLMSDAVSVKYDYDFLAMSPDWKDAILEGENPYAEYTDDQLCISYYKESKDVQEKWVHREESSDVMSEYIVAASGQLSMLDEMSRRATKDANDDEVSHYMKAMVFLLSKKFRLVCTADDYLFGSYTFKRVYSTYVSLNVKLVKNDLYTSVGATICKLSWSFQTSRGEKPFQYRSDDAHFYISEFVEFINHECDVVESFVKERISLRAKDVDIGELGVLGKLKRIGFEKNILAEISSIPADVRTCMHTQSSLLSTSLLICRYDMMKDKFPASILCGLMPRNVCSL